MIKKISFDSHKSGPRILVLGGVHGNETCGVAAINKVIALLKEQQLALASGKITFVPICNEKAFEKKERFIKTNLNRVITLEGDSKDYERALGREIAKLILEHDYLIDLHSFTADGEPFAIEDLDSEEQYIFSSRLGISPIIKGLASKVAETHEAATTVAFAAINNIPGILVECGQHDDDKAVEVAFSVIKKALSYENSEATGTPTRYQIQEVYFRKSLQDKFIRNFHHLEPVKIGDILTSTGIVAPFDSFVVLPNKNAVLKAEWFYLATQKNSK